MIGSRALLKSILLLLLFCNQTSKKLTVFFFLLGCFQGVETTRHFLLEWLSYAHRYIPVGLLEVIPQQLNWRPPNYFGRNDLETLMASDSAADWVRLTELVLGPPPSNFTFSPKHKSNAYDKAENG
jgi:tRNA-dihydrouridine synthase 3